MMDNIPVAAPGDAAARPMKVNVMRAAIAASVLAFAMPASSQAYDGAILVVSAADGRIPAPELRPRIKSALEARGVRHTDAELASLAELAASATGSGRPAMRTVCLPKGSPCVRLVSE